MAEDHDHKFRILLGITGSVAAIKGPELVVRLVENATIQTRHNVTVEVRVLLTRGGKEFWSKAAEYDPLSWERLESMRKLLPSRIEVYGEDY
jgi:Flavoprotein